MWSKTWGGHVTNNMTISQIQRVAVKKIYMSTSPSSSDPVGFGKHCAMTYYGDALHLGTYKFRITELIGP